MRLVSVESLIEWCKGMCTATDAISSRSDWARGFDRAMERTVEEAIAGRFNIPSTESEGEAALREQYQDELIGERDYAIGEMSRLRVENERLEKFCKEWVWGEDKFQEFGGWERIEAMKAEIKRLREALEFVHGELIGGNIFTQNSLTLTITKIEQALSTSDSGREET